VGLEARKYALRVFEYGDHVASDEVMFEIYNQPTLTEINPKLMLAAGGTLMTISGSGFFKPSNGPILIEFACNNEHVQVNGTWISSSVVQFR
jgi:hypothetical protein